VAVGEVRPGYELWRPNREKAESITTKFVLVLLLVATSAIAALVTIAGFSLITGGGGMGVICLIYAALYAFFAFLVFRWNRGILPVAAALSMILAIFCAVGADSWFARDKAGFENILNQVSAAMDTATLTDLGKQIAVDNKDIAAVATAWLQSKGLV